MSKNLIIYYSRKGQNYVNGSIKDLKKGNTEIVAEFVQKAVGGDLFEIETVREYSKDYMTCTEEAQEELRTKARPELKRYLDDISEYDNVFVCGPCWWGTFPMAVLTQPENIVNTLHAYQLAKRCNEKRTMYEAVEWGKRGARLNDIAPGIIVTPLAVDEFNGIRGDFYKNMFAKCPAGRPGTTDEVADVAELLMSERAQFITGATFLVDGGATASYYYGPLQPGLETGMEEGKQ